MRYRRMTYRYTMVAQQAAGWSLVSPWRMGLLSLTFGRPYWRPDADMCETRDGIDVVVDLAGVREDDVEIQFFDDALVIEGHRHLPGCQEDAVYHAAGVRQGPFRLELPLPDAVDTSAVDARYERGLLRITVPKREAAG